MTNAEKKHYLGQYKIADNQIDQLLEELARWKAKSTAVSPVYSDVPKGHNGADRMADAVARIVELEDEITERIDALVNMRRQIEADIATVPDGRLQQLLRYRYIDGMTWERIAVEMHYSYMQVCRLHGRALDEMML